MAWSFAADWGEYRYTPTEEWLTDYRNTPCWLKNLPDLLGLDEPGDDEAVHHYIDYIKTPYGSFTWHLFAYVAYNIKLRDDVNKIGKDKVLADVNGGESPIFHLDATKHLYQSGSVLLDNRYAVFMARLFNYWHCKALGRPELFNLRPRGGSSAKCPACNCVFTSSARIVSNPTKDVVAATWGLKDSSSGGYEISADTRI